MNLQEHILYFLSQKWRHPLKKRFSKYSSTPNTEKYINSTFVDRYNKFFKNGVYGNIADKDILEVGCGYGAFCCYAASKGARFVIGIDISQGGLRSAQKLKEKFENNYNRGFRLPINYIRMDAAFLSFNEESFNSIYIDNVFEHLNEPEKVLKECYRVLRIDGRIIIPIFSSIYSKWGLHLKNGLKLPWANVFFSKKTIITVMKKNAIYNKSLYDIYPGLKDNPKTIRDLRPNKDLNELTYRQFKKIVIKTGFHIKTFNTIPVSIIGKILSKLPVMKETILADIFSKGAFCVLEKIAL